MTVGEAIYKVRIASNLSLSDLSKKTGFFSSFLRKVEKNEIVPEKETLIKILKALEASEILINFLSVDESVLPVDKKGLFLGLSPIILDLFVEFSVNPKDAKLRIAQMTNTTDRPVVFISYSWDSDNHKSWVRRLANDLIDKGVEVIVDIYNLKAGGNRSHFMDDSITKSDYVLVILTNNYRDKSNLRTGGVGYEYSLINQELYENISSNTKIVPILREGTISVTVPTFLKQFIAIDFSDDKKYKDSLDELLRLLYDAPKYKRPPYGPKPTF